MKQIVGIADMKVSNNPEVSVITYSLGSCIGLVIYDPVVKVGGILHYMLPESSIDNEKASRNPFMFADTGIPRLFKTAYNSVQKSLESKFMLLVVQTFWIKKIFLTLASAITWP